MGPHFRSNVALSAGFFVIRFIVSISLALGYIIVAAGIQYAVVGILGETTFNYIVGGLLSLFLGAIICDRVGALIFMFVRGWHVSALAYATKIRKSGAPAVTVGMKAFAKNIVGFGAVYGIRTLAKSLLADFKDKLWDLLSEVPLAQNLQQVAENPIVEHLATDVLNYGFDAAIFYIIKNPCEDLNDATTTILEGLKRYLYCLPSIMLTSVSTYILFRFIPQLCKWLLILWVLFTNGICAGILITVLMWPIFYILDNTFFVPLTMIMFISCFSKEYGHEPDADSPVVQMVNAVLDGEGIGTTAEEFEDVDAPEEAEEPAKTPKSPTREAPPPPPPPMPTVDMTTSGQEPPAPPMQTGWREALSGSAEPMVREDEDSFWDDMPLTEEGPEQPPVPSESASPYDDMLNRLSQLGGVGVPMSGAGPGGFGGGDASGGLGALLHGMNQSDIGKALNGGGDDEDEQFHDFLSGGGDFE